MKLTMTYRNAFALIDILNKYQTVKRRLGLMISRTKKNLLDEIQIFNQEKDKLIKEYGKQGSDGNFSISKDDANFEEFNTELNTLADTTFEAEIYQVSQQDFDDSKVYEDDNLSSKDFDFLLQFFVESGKADNFGAV